MSASPEIRAAQLTSLFQPVWNWRAFWPSLDQDVAWSQVAALGVMVLITLLAYRRIDAAGRLMVVLWAGMLLTVAWTWRSSPSSWLVSSRHGPHMSMGIRMEP